MNVLLPLQNLVQAISSPCKNLLVVPLHAGERFRRIHAISVRLMPFKEVLLDSVLGTESLIQTPLIYFAVDLSSQNLGACHQIYKYDGTHIMLILSYSDFNITLGPRRNLMAKQDLKELGLQEHRNSIPHRVEPHKEDVQGVNAERKKSGFTAGLSRN